VTIVSGRHVASDHTAGKNRTAASVLSALLSMLLGIAALAACAPSTPARIAPTATAQATATATAAPRLVYQADWSRGLAGWAPTSGWTVSDGVLRSDTGNDRQITLPFRPETPNYAVEFRLRIVSLVPSAGTQYALRADPTAGLDGFVALVEHVTVPGTRLFPDHPHEMIYIDPMADQEDYGAHTLQIHDYEPGTIWRTYRVEIRGPLATLLIDGRISSWARSTKAPQLSAGAIHFFCTGIELQMSDLKVYSL
jgi:hypothetical protein